MLRDISEPDWKLFRQFHRIALERFCDSVLAEIGRLASYSSESAHQRYLAVYRLLQRRDKELGEVFDDIRRSTALLRVATMCSRGLLTEDEFARFSPDTRGAVAILLGE